MPTRRTPAQRLRALARLALLAFLLAACRGGGASPTAAPPTAPPTPVGDAVPCMPGLRVVPAAGTPGVTAAEAEAQVRARFNPANDPQRGQLGALLEARHVTVAASSREWEAGQGRWMLTFAFLPPAPQPSQFPIPGTAWRTIAFADTVSGFSLNSCSGPLPVGATPTP